MAWVERQGRSSPASFDDFPPEEVIFGRTEIMREIRQRIEKVAPANVPVLIQGESGTGKEVIAKLVHAWSPWQHGRFVQIHCPAIPATLLESELFGYEAGAFTGAQSSKPGRVEAAHQGTLFLDEIAELNGDLQAKLLHLLQDGQVYRIGAQEGKTVDVRLLCATHRPIERAIRTGGFRADLFYRINVVNLHLPRLRDRKDDIPQLVDYFLRSYNAKHNRQALPVSAACLQRLQEYEWPGNIRELQNLVHSYVVLGSESATLSDFLDQAPAEAQQPDAPGECISLRKIARQAAREAERKVILQVLEANQGNRKKTARALNLSYRALLYKIKEVGIPPKRFLVLGSGPSPSSLS